ncbi:putative S-adenosylmethionine-dependent methyltransferase [Sphaerosporella brunnea]|uniref:Putative S-adenosylmethionine-dependent methyltransferase n=1 Tax=Sphaerosporella brunnea TaxID=1250544 RepID=A0A5J5F2I7_9PEZI|nr:putative S-adenosylmethionine-dependent methyltransferase [Sphaerosporella brunnea]
MATFSAATFSSARYATFRPAYPTTLFTHHLLPYHQGARNVLLDLGCGPGTVTRPLSVHFSRTIGTDPSEGMLNTARELTPEKDCPTVTYRRANAEQLAFLKDGEVDMAVAAQAVHWFDHAAWWAEMARVVRKGGTVAVWGYKDCMIPRAPKASRVLSEYTHGKDKLGPYWSQPGRSYVQGRLRVIRPAEKEWEAVKRWEFEPKWEVPVTEEEESWREEVEEGDGKEGFGELVNRGEGLMRKTVTLGGMDSYIRTWSCTHAWKEAFPEAKSKAEGGQGDIVDELMEKMKEAEGWGEGWRDMFIEIAWGHGVILARRK